jgi:hypothetical protein
LLCFGALFSALLCLKTWFYPLTQEWLIDPY